MSKLKLVNLNTIPAVYRVIGISEIVRRTFFLLLSAIIFLLTLPTFTTPAITSAAARSKGKNTVVPSQANYELGLKKFDEGDIDGAVDAFLQAIYFERAGYHPKAYYWLGCSYARKHEDGKAIEALELSIKQNLEKAADAYCLLAELYMRNDRLSEAQNAADRAVASSDGPNPQACNVMGLIDLKQGDFADAQSNFMNALGDPPWHYTEAWMNLANSMLLLRDWSGAVRHYKRMIAAKDRLKGIKLDEIYSKLGYCVLQVGDHQGALDAWHMSLNYNPNHAEAHFQLAGLLDTERHYSSAIKEYREFIRCADEKQSPEKLAQVRNRLTWLEQKVKPVEADPQAARPSPYMRKQAEEQLQAQKKAELEAQKKAGFTGPYDPTNPHESGF